MEEPIKTSLKGVHTVDVFDDLEVALTKPKWNMIYMGKRIPHPNLKDTVMFKTYLSKEQEQEIIEDMKRQCKINDGDRVLINVNIEIERYK